MLNFQCTFLQTTNSQNRGELQSLRKQHVTINYVIVKLESSIHIILRYYSLLISEEIKIFKEKLKLLTIFY